MAEEKTVRERLALLEAKNAQLDRVIKDYEGMEVIHQSLIDELAKTNNGIKELSNKVDKMYPIVRDIIYAKGYGNFTWKVMKWIGGIVFVSITSWHYFKDGIKHFFHYIFN